MRRRTDLQRQPTSQSDRLTDCQDGSADRSTDKDGQTTEKTDGHTRCADGNTDGCTDGQTRANQLGSVGSSRCRHGAPSEAISMDQPGEGKQLLPQRQYNCFSTPPPAQPVVVGLHVNFRVILLSYRRLITRRLGNLVTLPCYCLLVITATPLRRLRYAVTRAPLSRSLRDGSGRLGTGPGRTRQSKPLYIHARTNWLVRQWALLHGPARAGPRWVPGGQGLDRGKAIAH